METFELRYFVAAALKENLHKGAEAVHASPASLSKAISRLEGELGVKLFYHEGRNIRLTPEGIFLRQRAMEILRLEEDTKTAIGGTKGSLNVSVGADEILMSFFGVTLTDKIRERFPHAIFHLSSGGDEASLQKLQSGEVQLALVTSDVPRGLKSKTIGKFAFKTWASTKHPLLKGRGKSTKVTIEEVLKHPFVVPETAILGRITDHGANDGWYDHRLPRIHGYRTGSLKVMENYVQSGAALAYLPDYFFKGTEMVALQITGCSFSCTQSVKIVCKNPERLGWLSQVWEMLT